MQSLNNTGHTLAASCMVSAPVPMATGRAPKYLTKKEFEDVVADPAFMSSSCRLRTAYTLDHNSCKP